jgi:hypothetical protein
MLGWDEYGLDKKCIGARYIEHMFLHPVGSVGHVVYSCASRAQNGDTLFFMLGFDFYGSDKKSDGTRYAKLVFLHLMGSAGHVVHSGAPEARNGDALFFMLGWDRYRFDKKKMHLVKLRRTYVFTSGGICGSHSAFWCVRGMKQQHNIFHAWVG